MENKEAALPAEKEAGPQTYAGHRRRMRQRYRQSGLAALEAHEVLEILLFRVLPRRDTNPLAHILLDAAGTVEGVLEADVSVAGVGEKTRRFLQNTRDSLTDCFLKTLLPADPAEPIGLDRPQFYTTAVWFLRRYTEHILLLVCGEAGEPEEVGIIGDASLKEIPSALHTAASHLSADENIRCHLACIGRRDEMASMRQEDPALGMLLSITNRWEPVWL